MYNSAFSSDIKNMLEQLHTSGLQVKYIDYFLHDFDDYCAERYPEADTLTMELSEAWIRIHNAITPGVSQP